MKGTEVIYTLGYKYALYFSKKHLLEIQDSMI